MTLKYRVTRDHSQDLVQVPIGTVLHYMPDHQHHAEAEARFNNKVLRLNLDLVAVSFDGRGWFPFPRSSLEEIAEGCSERQMSIAKRLDVLEKLLNVEGPIHPPSCDCAIKSRTTLHHMPSCPYRQLREIVDELRALSREDSGT